MWAWGSCLPAEMMYSSSSNAREQMLVGLPRAEWPVNILCVSWPVSAVQMWTSAAVLPAARCAPLFEKVRVVVGDCASSLIWWCHLKTFFGQLLCAPSQTRSPLWSATATRAGLRAILVMGWFLLRGGTERVCAIVKLQGVSLVEFRCAIWTHPLCERMATALASGVKAILFMLCLT
jgi:hypothetical protein